MHITDTSESYFPVHLSVVVCVIPHCANVFRAMQVTTGMHSIRAFKADNKTPTQLVGNCCFRQINYFIKAQKKSQKERGSQRAAAGRYRGSVQVRGMAADKGLPVK